MREIAAGQGHRGDKPPALAPPKLGSLPGVSPDPGIGRLNRLYRAPSGRSDPTSSCPEQERSEPIFDLAGEHLIVPEKPGAGGLDEHGGICIGFSAAEQAESPRAREGGKEK